MGTLLSIMCMSAVGVLYSTSGTGSGGALPVIRCTPVHTVFKDKKRQDNPAVKEVSLRQLLEVRCPSLYRKFEPVWWLPK